MDTCTTESLRCSAETITTCNWLYTPIQNKKLKKKKKGGLQACIDIWADATIELVVSQKSMDLKSFLSQLSETQLWNWLFCEKNVFIT